MPGSLIYPLGKGDAVYGGSHSHGGGASGAHSHGGGSSGGGAPILIIIAGLAVVGGLVWGGISLTLHRHSLTNAESAVVSLKQEGIINRSKATVRLNHCPGGCDVTDTAYHRWLYIDLKNAGSSTHNVIYCGPEVSTTPVGDNAPDCFWFELKPGATIRKVISGNVLLPEDSGFKVVNWGGVEAIDDHRVPGAPEQLSYNDSNQLVVMAGDGGSTPAPG